MRKLMTGIHAKRLVLLAIAIPISIRTIPELLAGPYPLGFDAVWFYAPFIRMVEAMDVASLTGPRPTKARRTMAP